MPVPACLRLHPASLVTPRRLDLAVKWRFFAHLRHGGDEDAERVYRWHIGERSGHRMQAGIPTDKWKQSTDDYVTSARTLLASMQDMGFLASGAVPVDPNGELLDGSHRVACALAIGVPQISVMRLTRKAWAPPWDLAWFATHGMTRADLVRVLADFDLMQQ